MTPLLTTPRLRLRAPSIGDATRFTELLGNFEVAKNLLNVPHPYSMENARQFLANWRANPCPENTRFVIELGTDGAIGVIGYRETEKGARLGYWIGQPFWGRGLMTEATKAVVHWYFSVTRAEMILSGAFHFNMASLAVQHKLGFVETGRATLHCLALGEDVEHIDTELTREAFEALNYEVS